MNYRKLGTNGPVVSAIGFGAMPLSGTYGQVDEAEAIATIRRALDLGINMIDTAERYGEEGHNEILVGRAIKGLRDKVFLATKFGSEVKGPDGTRGGNGSAENVRRSIDGSLKRLGVDHVDLYYLHRMDPVTPIEETVGAMADLVRQGKIRYIGLSEASPSVLRHGHAVHPIAALQTEYSLVSRDPEADVLPTVRELGVGFVAYSPLGRGLLTGRVEYLQSLPDTDRRRRVYPRFQGENLGHNLGLVERLRQIAQAKGITTAQLALAWLLHQREDVVPIPGTRRQANLEANVAAVDIMLDANTLGEVGEIGRAVSGERGGADYMSNVYRGGESETRA